MSNLLKPTKKNLTIYTLEKNNWRRRVINTAGIVSIFEYGNGTSNRLSAVLIQFKNGQLINAEIWKNDTVSTG